MYCGMNPPLILLVYATNNDRRLFVQAEYESSAYAVDLVVVDREEDYICAKG